MKVTGIFKTNESERHTISLFLMSVAAGFPVAAGNDIENQVDINDFIVSHPLTSFFVKVSGHDLMSWNIYDDDILLVDTSIQPSHYCLVLVNLNGIYFVKIHEILDGEIVLSSDTGFYLPLRINDDFQYQIIGVVRLSIHSV